MPPIAAGIVPESRAASRVKSAARAACAGLDRTSVLWSQVLAGDLGRSGPPGLGVIMPAPSPDDAGAVAPGPPRASGPVPPRSAWLSLP